MLASAAAHLGAVPDEAGLVRDLRQFEYVLERLAARGIRWHLGVEA
jgi:hypothetical protein